jgi:hypothetical protein
VRGIVVISLVTATVLCACGGHRRDAAPDTTALRACEIRQLQFGNVAATVVANSDASLSEVDVDGGSEAERHAATQSAYRAFGQPHIDTDVHQIQSKWGLSAWVDRCGRAAPPRVAVPTHGSPAHLASPESAR